MPNPNAHAGSRAEDLVALYLEEAGAQILARNLHMGRFEIDLVARDGPVIAVVEVRTRSPGSWQRALESIDGAKRQRIRQAGERLWRSTFATSRDVERMRFDCASVSFRPNGPAIEYVRGAF